MIPSICVFENLNFSYDFFGCTVVVNKLFLPVLCFPCSQDWWRKVKKRDNRKTNFAYSMFGWLYGLLLLIVDDLVRVKMYCVFFITQNSNWVWSISSSGTENVRNRFPSILWKWIHQLKHTAWMLHSFVDSLYFGGILYSLYFETYFFNANKHIRQLNGICACARKCCFFSSNFFLRSNFFQLLSASSKSQM